MKKYNERILCVSAQDNITTVKDLLNCQIHVLDRTEAETNEKFRQIIPYVTVRNNKDEIYTYERIGGDPRLIGKYSIGVGGHMNNWPALFENISLSLILFLEATRELDEELEIPIERLPELSQMFASMSENLIIFNDTPIDRVHIGVSMQIEVDFPIQVREKEILKGKFMSIEELHTNEVYSNLENWSKHVLKDLKNDNKSSNIYTTGIEE